MSKYNESMPKNNYQTPVFFDTLSFVIRLLTHSEFTNLCSAPIYGS